MSIIILWWIPEPCHFLDLRDFSWIWGFHLEVNMFSLFSFFFIFFIKKVMGLISYNFCIINLIDPLEESQVYWSTRVRKWKACTLNDRCKRQKGIPYNVIKIERSQIYAAKFIGNHSSCCIQPVINNYSSKIKKATNNQLLKTFTT